MNKTRTICFCNNKGGSGKSTCCSNLGYALSEKGHKVLLIDGDMQLNLSLSFFPEDMVLEMAKGEKNLYVAVKKQESLSAFCISTPYPNLDLIPSSMQMRSIEYELANKNEREFVLKKGLREIRESGKYDYILLDAPPTLGGWVMNIMCASDFLIIPVEASPWGLFGLANMFEFSQKVELFAPELKLLGVAITKVDERKNYFRQTRETLNEIEDIRVFQSYIHIDSAVEWAQDNSKPVLAYKKGSRSAKEFRALAEEVEEICQ